MILIERTDNQIDLAKLYNIANVLYNPTYEDTYPTVNLEAIACGLPIMTYDTGGSKESAHLIENSTNLIKINNVENNLIQVKRVLNDIEKSKSDININSISCNYMIKNYYILYEGV